ncbi:MAG TPA: MarR family transcriptional regulator [Acidimicrobiales bacterium]|nr:MarR family transcriptional regulator [Acidimicrobiales bacterium]
MLRFDPIAEARRQWEEHGLPEPVAMAGTTSIMRAQQLVLSRVDAALRPLGLTFARYEALRLLAFSRAGRLPMAKIGVRLMVHPASVTNTIDRLEAQGLVRREPHPSDGRTTLAAITPAGRRVVQRATKALGAVRFGLDLPDDRVAELVDILRDFRAAAGDFGAD